VVFDRSFCKIQIYILSNNHSLFSFSYVNNVSFSVSGKSITSDQANMLKSVSSPRMMPMYGRGGARGLHTRFNVIVAAFLLSCLTYSLYLEDFNLPLGATCNTISKDLSKPRIDAGNSTLGVSASAALKDTN
jgi:hypothetical protein